ncbi:Nicotinamide/nicotinic acid mononucleotide adenylyltransferase 1 [Gnomoniopsis smithogilvyi]|uniref:Nicotinamide-nucleotide adenylyltransferase n=1 Tax=Gnomoniopsis smithogilvyi TaxID=1191159 RepID=A0A9W8YV63_9PEZI|nr:Nicotinamide/nicotinic acid mononucleotide adenylyltransferase 1 [Gnomoniopsis smithogilvyi]
MATETTHQQALPSETVDQMDIDHSQQITQPEASSSLSNVVPDSQLNPETYRFPSERLRRRQRQADKIPLVLVACGSFSPITFLHLRMFEMASDYAKFNTKYEIVGGFLSPVSEAYKKQGLASAKHRIQMCSFAASKTSDWLSCDPWEAIQPDYVPTAQVLDHFDHEINVVLGGCEDVHGNKQPVRIALLAGADLIQTMSTPGVWSEKDLDHILGNFGAFIIERTGTDIDEALAGLKQYQDKIHVIPQVIINDVSSTKVRLMRKRDLSLRYVVPDPVIDYIQEHGLYRE